MFKVGDRVRLMVDEPDFNHDLSIGSEGTVCGFDDSSKRIAVRWGGIMCMGHDCDNLCDYGYGWYVNDYEIDLLQQCPELAPVSEDDFLLMLG